MVAERDRRLGQARMAQLDARKFIDRFGAARRRDVRPDGGCRGKPRKVVVLSAPRYPGMVDHVTRFLMASTYEPQLRNCVPVATTLKGAGLPFFVQPPYTQSVLAPVYPAGWSAQHKSACKVPAVTHDSQLGDRPETRRPRCCRHFAASMKNLSVDDEVQDVGARSRKRRGRGHERSGRELERATGVRRRRAGCGAQERRTR